MTQRNLLARVSTAAFVAVLALGATSADAAVQAGNYQTHVLKSTTRTTADQDTSADHQRVAAENERNVRAGNYQTHVLPSSTRRTPEVKPVSTAHDVAVNHRSPR